MRLSKSWDTQFIKWLYQAENYDENSISILSCYPSGYKLDSDDDTQSNPVAMCFKEFDCNGLPTFKSKLIKRNKYFKNPFKSLFYAAGFVFGRSIHLLNEITKYSKSIEYLFTGEEIYQQFKLYKYSITQNKSLRIYSPPNSMIFHLWSRSYRPTFKADCNNIFSSSDLLEIKEKEHSAINSILEEMCNPIFIPSIPPYAIINSNQSENDINKVDSNKTTKTELSFNEYLREECGIDIIIKKITNPDLALMCGLDSEFFK